MPKRNMAQYIKPTDAKTIWLTDYGAYPVMGVIVFAGAFCTWWNYRLLTSQPRISWKKSTRGLMMKESEKDAMSYYNHSLRRMGKAKHGKMMKECIEIN
eukprot:CAMPEP_0167756688 /NCGR_PEP_ID=MMETSP0110_2-20121227/9522_1 /TAXON_ID=629695 /ORGANISM="Gymnochlora sp., Strain CCMP2014" /LENGTH=98 /DNA_ID=CAMNT_0007642821 /DNA_START=120 /DNA_END=416 /DNA_ORIENTATION=-